MYIDMMYVLCFPCFIPKTMLLTSVSMRYIYISSYYVYIMYIIRH